MAETVAINPALAISGLEILHQWYYNPAYFATMSDCANTAIGVWYRAAAAGHCHRPEGMRRMLGHVLAAGASDGWRYRQ